MVTYDFTTMSVRQRFFGSPYFVNIIIFSWEQRKKCKPVRKKKKKLKKNPEKNPPMFVVFPA